MSPAIVVEDLGKLYRLGETKGSTLMRDAMAGWLRRPFRNGDAKNDKETLWALRDVSFTVERGEAIGIIGRNGSGKSTLLKLISRITEPTRGRIRLHGRVASLLEVGTGFHPDLTGRENIFLNGAILGMPQAETRRKFDEIVAFAGLERFIDTPVRRYSSGMSVRLAFAVAAHLEPEILLLDEVLAVGDADFQRKCLRKMNDVTKHEGRTVLLVSHQLASIQQLCDRVLVLNRGQLLHDTDTAAGIAAYVALTAQSAPKADSVVIAPGLHLAEFEFSPNPVEVFGDLEFRMRLRTEVDCSIHDLCLFAYDEFGQRAGIADLRHTAQSYDLSAGEALDITGRLRRIALVPGTYAMGFYLRTNSVMDDFLALRSIEVQPASTGGPMTYAIEHLGRVALDAAFNATIGSSNSEVRRLTSS